MLWDYVKFCMLYFPEQIICDDRISKTFCQMVDEVEVFARGLTGQKYGIFCYSDVLTIKALLACLAANVTAVPLSNRYGKEHRKRIIESIQLNAIISDKDERLFIERNGSCKIETELENVAWILSTSGSSGEPKGVMLSEKAIYQNLKASESFFSYGNQDVLLANRGFYHCSSLTGELIMSLIKGVKICCSSIGFAPYLILNKMEFDYISLYSGTPTVFYQLCRTMKKKEVPNVALKYCNVGGEPMDPLYRDTIVNTLKETKLVHSYGMTEACSRATYHYMHDNSKEPSCVGKMISCMESVVVDKSGNEVSSGKKGEILLRGACIMNGYYGNQKLTDSVLQNGWLKTGDIGFKDSDEMLYSCGRKDNMLIRAGINIYPQEIEYILKKHPLIENVKVDIQYINTKNSQLHARVCLVKPYQRDYGKLLEICKDYLLSYQMPDTIELVNSITLSQAGKVV